MTRSFEDRPAMRERVPLLLGLTGPSGGGKTMSALRLATGMQRVTGGDILFIDTEARRALHYADKFKFRHVDFGAPFGSLDYLAAIEHCVDKGAGVVVVDSMSHEHEGPGGMLEFHERETERLTQLWNLRSKAAAQMPAWSAPKRDRRRLINTILQLPCNFIFCFRAKEKIKIKKGEDPQALGYMAISGDEFIFEMTLNALLLPAAGGKPSWSSAEIGERQQIKRPGWAAQLVPDGAELSEAQGQALAEWAAGTVVRSAAEIELALDACATPAALGGLKSEIKQIWSGLSANERKALREASERATARVLEALADANETTPAPSEAGGE